jgi:hypothetical protein
MHEVARPHDPDLAVTPALEAPEIVRSGVEEIE